MKHFLLVVFLIPFACFAQVDSTYIGFYGQGIAPRTFIARDFIYMVQETKGAEDKTYMPNNPVKLGLGLSINNSVVNIGYGYGFDFLRDRSLGKTKSFDFQYHYYGRKFVADLFVQEYEGFYLDDNSKNPTVYSDMTMRMYGLHGLYILNNKKYSYRAAFNHTEKQLKSAGSFLLGVGAYTTKISGDSSFLYKDKTIFRSFQIGISGGYAYTWVLGRRWFINGSTTVGINFGAEKFSRFGKDKLDVSPSVFPRISVGYNKQTWALGFSYVNNILFNSVSSDNSISVHSGSFQFTFVKRFNMTINKKITKYISYP